MLPHERTPLDIEQVLEQTTERTRNPYSAFLELIPISVIGTAILLRYLGSNYWPHVLTIGAGMTITSYLFLSWYLLKVSRYVALEVFLSVLFGLLSSAGIIGILFKLFTAYDGNQLMITSMYGSLGMIGACFLLLIFHFRDSRASVFYRSILSRLFVLTMILFRMFIGV